MLSTAVLSHSGAYTSLSSLEKYWANRSFSLLFVLFERIYIIDQRKHSVVYLLCVCYSICIAPALSLPHHPCSLIFLHTSTTHESTQKLNENSTIISAIMYGRHQSCEPNAESNLFELCWGDADWRRSTCDDYNHKKVYSIVAQKITHWLSRSPQVATLQPYITTVYKFHFSHISQKIHPSLLSQMFPTDYGQPTTDSWRLTAENGFRITDNGQLTADNRQWKTDSWQTTAEDW